MFNVSAFNKTKYSSNLAGVLSYIVHKIETIGSYEIYIISDKKVVLKLLLNCDENVEIMQQNLDLHNLKYHLNPKYNEIKIQKNGHIIFYCSQGSKEYKILIKRNAKSRNKEVAFDSDKPKASDKFIVTPLNVGTYEITSRGKLIGNIQVLINPRIKKPAEQLHPIPLTIDSKGIQGKGEKSLPGQPIMFTNLTNTKFTLNILKKKSKK